MDHISSFVLSHIITYCQSPSSPFHVLVFGYPRLWLLILMVLGAIRAHWHLGSFLYLLLHGKTPPIFVPILYSPLGFAESPCCSIAFCDRIFHHHGLMASQPTPPRSKALLRPLIRPYKTLFFWGGTLGGVGWLAMMFEERTSRCANLRHGCWRGRPVSTFQSWGPSEWVANFWHHFFRQKWDPSPCYFLTSCKMRCYMLDLHPTQDASGKWRFRLGSLSLKM